MSPDTSTLQSSLTAHPGLCRTLPQRSAIAVLDFDDTSASGWLASSGRLDLVRIRCDLAAAAPQAGLEPKMTDAALFMNVRFETGSDLVALMLPRDVI